MSYSPLIRIQSVPYLFFGCNKLVEQKNYEFEEEVQYLV
jgi:hypothetical protein